MPINLTIWRSKRGQLPRGKKGEEAAELYVSNLFIQIHQIDEKKERAGARRVPQQSMPLDPVRDLFVQLQSSEYRISRSSTRQFAQAGKADCDCVTYADSGWEGEYFLFLELNLLQVAMNLLPVSLS